MISGTVGAGRICVALAELGVTLDPLRQAVIDPEASPGELDAFDLGDRFDTIVLGSHLQNLPDEPARSAFVRAAARHAMAGARIFLEHHPIDWAETAAATRPTPGGSELGMVDVRRDPPFVSAVSVYDIGGRIVRQPFKARVLSEAELDQTLSGSGLIRRVRLSPTWLEATLRTA